MPAPQLISYEAFLEHAQELDIRALTYLAAGEPIKEPDPAVAATYRYIGERLFNSGCLTRFRESTEVLGGETWFVFDGRVAPGALNYIALCAMERVMLSRLPIPAPTPEPTPEPSP